MRVLITGARGMVGCNLLASWERERPDDLILAPDRNVLDLRDSATVIRYIRESAPDIVVHAAAHVGGISDKISHPAEYLLNNVAIDSSILRGCLAAQVETVIVVSSAAIYPEDAPQPFREDSLLSGVLETANEPYSLAKIVASKACEYISREYGYSYRALAPSNLYGVYDTFVPERAHLVASALAKCHEAKLSGWGAVNVWGNGTARREFTFAGDLSDWIVTNIGQINQWPVLLNLGVGIDHSVREYYETAAAVVGFAGDLEFDTNYPVGVQSRLLDSGEARRHGWHPETSLKDGMIAAYQSFLEDSDI